MLTPALLLAALACDDPASAHGFVLERVALEKLLDGPVILAVDRAQRTLIAEGGGTLDGGRLLHVMDGTTESIAQSLGPVRGLHAAVARTLILGGGTVRAVGEPRSAAPFASGLPLDAQGLVAALDGGLYAASATEVWRVDGAHGAARRVAGGFRGLSGLVATEDGSLIAHDVDGLVQVLPGVDGGVAIQDGERPCGGATAGVLVTGSAWEPAYGTALYWAYPELGEVHRVELVARGASWAVGLREVVLRGAPATFRPAAIAAGPDGDRLVIAAFEAGQRMSLWTLTRPGASAPPEAGGLDDERQCVRIDAQRRAASHLEQLDALERGLVGDARPLAPGAVRQPGVRAEHFGTFGEARTRRHAVWALAGHADFSDADVRRRARLLLERALVHVAPDVREQAALALAHWPHPLIEPDRLVGLLRDEAPTVRRAAAYAVTARGFRLAGGELVAALDEGGDAALTAALRAAVLDLRVWEALAERIARRVSEPERREALWSLFAGTGDEDAIYAIAQLARRQDANFRVRREALELLASLWQVPTPGAEPWPGNARIRRALERGLEDEAPIVREQAAAGLAQIGD